MRLKTWLVAALGLGSLVALIALSMLASSRKAQDIYTQIDQLNTHHRNVEAKLRALRSDVHLSSIFLRDYLLDVERDHAPEYRDQLAEFRRTNVATLTELRPLVGRDEQIMGLQLKLDQDRETFDPLFDWTPSEKIRRSAAFLRREVVPRRNAVLAIAQEIEELNDANLAGNVRRSPSDMPHCAWSRSLALQTCYLAWRSHWSSSFGCGFSSSDPTRPSARCANCRSNWSTAGRGAKEPVARAPRSRGAGAHRIEDGTRSAGTDDGTVR